ncbi:chitin binding Peritrophin-A domain protein [Ancylostoma ceylanicum]|uniref:Chitin binding Peritrophin-A domain protein n=1 Tax=Ancylostoma ceylanicum TaxID=53326 RepID=A0A0D6M5F5_9BILA|nr:chitin binding Peritrophin-A domain protein [Ancylostoma ceylanicum]
MIRLTLLTLFVNLAVPYPGSRTETNFCSDKKPGLFSQGCSSNVTICNSFGREMWLLCPFGLIFDGSIEECVDYRLASECSAKDKQTKTGIRHLAEGFHAVTTCSSSVIQCTPAGPSLMECPLGLVYDDSNYLCVNPSELASCQPAKAPEEPKAEAFVEASGAVPAHSVESKNSRQIPMYCPAKLAFDETRQLCDYPLAVAACAEENSGEGSAESSGESSGEESGEEASGEESGEEASGEESGEEASGEESGEEASGEESGEEASGEESGEEASGEESGEEASGEESGEDASGEESGEEVSGESSGYDESAGKASGESSGEASGEFSGDGSGGLSEEASGNSEASGESSDFPPSELASEGSAYAPMVEESWDSTPEPVEPENTTPVPQQCQSFQCSSFCNKEKRIVL